MISAAIINDSNERVIDTIKSIESSCYEIILVETKNKIFKVEHPKVKNYFFEWNDDFSEVRNYSLSKCSGNWILVIDSDEVLEKPIGELSNEVDYYFCKVDSGTTFYGTRLFKNNLGIKFENKCHEHTDDSIRHLKGGMSDIVLFHSGYTITKEQMRVKAERNIRLLLKDKPHTTLNFDLARTYFELGEYEKTIEYGLMSLEDDLNNDAKAGMCNLIHDAHLAMGKEIDHNMLIKSIQLIPLQVTARYRIINYLFKFGNKELALREMEKIKNICHFKNSNLSNDIYIDETFINEKIKEIQLWR